MPPAAHLFLALALLAAVPARGQTPVPTSPAPAPSDTAATRAWHMTAGSARFFFEGDERVSIYEGGVHLTSDSTTIDSRRARAYLQSKHAFFYEDVVVHHGDLVMNGDEGEFSRPDDVASLAGHVVIRDPRGTIYADRARYWRAQGLLRLWGHVDFQDPKTRVQADSVIYYEESGVGDAFGNVVITDVESGTDARGPRAVYERATGVARLVSRAHMVLRKQGAEDTEIDADILQSDRGRTLYRARGDVRIRRGTTTASADSALLYPEEDLLQLRGHPEVQDGATQMRGSEIDAHSVDDELRRVEVRRGAHIVQTRTDTLLVPDANEVRGDSATLYFEEGDLARAIVVGNATSKYVPRETRPDRISLNEAQADSVVMLFENDDIEEVLFIGAASGVYRYYEGDLQALRRPKTATFDTTFGVVRGDTTAFDFRRQSEIVEYSAERILYLAPQNDLLLVGAAQVDYEKRTLRAGRIRFDADTDLLDASERPVLDDSGQRMYGDNMGYDMGTRHAWVRRASTTFDQGYYTGSDLRKDEEGTLQVRSGSYTTCDLAHPHYRFEFDQMKIYMKDKMVGRPVRVYLGDVPVAVLPFIVNSVNTDRHSGFLQPYFEFGVFSDQRYIRGLDYYWAASQYFDVLLSSDFTDRQRPSRANVDAFLASAQDTRSLGLSMTTRYKMRYRFDGNINYRVQHDLGTNSRFWTLGGAHNQTLGERATLRGNLDYASSDRAVKQVNDFRDYERSLTRQLTSGLTLNRPGDLVSLSANLRRVQQVNPGEDYTGALVSSTLPSLNVTFRAIRLGPAPKDLEHPGWRGFLHDLQLRPGFNFARETFEERARRDTTTIPPGGVATADSFVVQNHETITASTGAGLSRRFPVWFLDVTPSVSYTESYRRDSRQPNAQRSSRRVGTGVSGATTFYGLFRPNHWGVTAIRHRIEPRASVSFTPEISGQQRRATSVSLSLANILDAKLAGDKEGEERRFDGLLNWALSTNYNPTTLGGEGQPDRKFGLISSTITINQSGPLRITIGQTYDPYTGKIIDTRVPFGMRLSGRFGYGDTGIEEAQRNRVVEEEGEAVPTPVDSTTIPGRLPDVRDALEGVNPVRVGEVGNLSWDLGLSYSLSRVNGQTQSARVGVSLAITPTRNWNVQYRASYDGRLRTFANPEFRITRDLHCWKASFARIRDVNDWRYYFRIYVAQHESDLFIENGDRALGYH